MGHHDPSPGQRFRLRDPRLSRGEFTLTVPSSCAPAGYAGVHHQAPRWPMRLVAWGLWSFPSPSPRHDAPTLLLFDEEHYRNASIRACTLLQHLTGCHHDCDIAKESDLILRTVSWNERSVIPASRFMRSINASTLCRLMGWAGCRALRRKAIGREGTPTTEIHPRKALGSRSPLKFSPTFQPVLPRDSGLSFAATAA